MTAPESQKILVFQQNGSAESKIAGIRKYGGKSLELTTISIDQPLPPVIDDTGDYLPDRLDADLVLDFLKHPDLSHDLANLCRKQGIPMIASGKKIDAGQIHTPPT
jgi:hypothetical protein